jgi:hypothetical protein
VRSLPCALRFLLATNPAALTQVLGVVYRTISGFLLQRAGLADQVAGNRAVDEASALPLNCKKGPAPVLQGRVFLASARLDQSID